MLYHLCTSMGLVPETWACPHYLLAPIHDDGTGPNDGSGWSLSWLTSTWITFCTQIDSCYFWAAYFKAPFRWLGCLITWIIDCLGDEFVGRETWSQVKQVVWVVTLLVLLALCFYGIDRILRPFVRREWAPCLACPGRPAYPVRPAGPAFSACLSMPCTCKQPGGHVRDHGSLVDTRCGHAQAPQRTQPSLLHI